MPLNHEPLPDEQIATIRQWIEQGAPWPEDVGADVQQLEKHWAYVKPARPELPGLERSDWVKNPIDAFVLARLEQEGLEPSPPADRERLLRRVYLDLIGLPPTVEQIDAFLADEAPGAYQRVVDRLLASPQYGAKWARHWLDLARYADSNGFQADQFRSVWPFRDWVMQAMNQDMPFDQFTIEQLAGDLLPQATVQQRIASGFHRLTTCNVEAGVDPEENRVNQVIDRVNTTSTVWLGTTMECSQCHNHKYDPFSHREYFQLFAYFNNTPLEVEGDGVTYNFVGPTMDLPLSPAQLRRRDALDEQLAALEQEISAREKTLRNDQPQWEAEMASSLDAAPQWHVLGIKSFESSGGASHSVLDDQSVLVSGKHPGTDVYTVVAETELTGITAFTLAALTDPSLPGEGPGRHHPERPNFVLYDFRVAAQAAESGTHHPITLHSAQATYSQPRYDVSGAIDGNSETAWAIHPRFHEPHAATFLTAEPAGFEGGTRLSFVLDQHHGGGRTIGRLRLSALTGPPSMEVLPEGITEILQTLAKDRQEKQQEELAKYYLEQDTRLTALRKQVTDLQTRRDEITPVTTLVMVEDEPRETQIFKRGSFLDPGETVEPATPAILHPLDDDLPPNRLGLAHWLVDPDNPLTYRFQGRPFRLTDIAGNVVTKLLA